MSWIKNLKNIAETKTSGNCPICGSDNTDYTLVGDIDSVGYGVVWCNDCKAAYHISRVLISKDYPLNKAIPQNLRY